MLDVCVASPFISFEMFEKKSFVEPLPTDVIDVFLISEVELVESVFVDDMASLILSSKLSCCWVIVVDSFSNPTYKINIDYFTL